VAYRWILFDADGTLLDFEKAAAVALQTTCEQVLGHFDPAYRVVYHRINSQLWRDLEAGRTTPERLQSERFQKFLSQLDLGTDPDAFGHQYLTNLGNQNDLLDGAEEAVRQLAATHRLMIITNGLKTVQRQRFAHGTLGRYFADLIISEEVGAAKPDPRIFDVAFERMGHPAKGEVLMVGDSLTSDIRGGHDYGLDTCWYNPGRQSNDLDLAPSYEIAHLNELPALINRCR